VNSENADTQSELFRYKKEMMIEERVGDSSTTCTDRRRAKFDMNDVKLSKLPTSSAGLESFQFGVFTAVTIASGRYSQRGAWSKCIIYARSPRELSHIARKCRGLDYKLQYTAMDICWRNRDLYELLRRLGEDTGNASQVCNGRQCLWRIYSYFSLPGSATLGLKVTYTVLDLSTIKLVGGNEGLVRCWGAWSHCVKRVMDNPPRTACEHLFVDEMRQAPMMLKYVREYDDSTEGHVHES
jgi:hypothetical protein